MPDVITPPSQTAWSRSAPDSLNSPRIAFLLNIIAPYHKPLFDRLSRRYPRFRIFLSAATERNRSWKVDWSGLDVVVQKTVTFNRRWRHPKGFSEPLFVHLPLDTVTQLARYRPQVIVSWEMGMRTMLAAVYRRLHRGTRLMVWAEFAESTEGGRGRLRRSIRRFLHHAVDGFIVTGASGARYLESIGVPRAKLYPIVYTTEVDRFAAVPLRRTPEAAHRLLYVGQLTERKGLLPFATLLSRWASAHSARPVELAFVGEGLLEDALRKLPLPPNLHFRFLGNIDYAALPQTYASAGLFVFPTLADTWGVVVNEALASGLPVLGSVEGQAVSELVVDGVNGWTFHPSSEEQICRALDSAFAADGETLHRMREAARATAVRLTPDYVAGLVDRAILSCLGSKVREAGA